MSDHTAMDVDASSGQVQPQQLNPSHAENVTPMQIESATTSTTRTTTKEEFMTTAVPALPTTPASAATTSTNGTHAVSCTNDEAVNASSVAPYHPSISATTTTTTTTTTTATTTIGGIGNISEAPSPAPAPAPVPAPTPGDPPLATHTVNLTEPATTTGGAAEPATTAEEPTVDIMHGAPIAGTPTTPLAGTHKKGKPLKTCRVQHQKLVLAINLPQRIMAGYTELSVLVPSSFTEIRINAAQMHISRVEIDGKKMEYTYGRSAIVPEDSAYVRDLASFNAYYKAAQEEDDLGELCVQLPPSLMRAHNPLSSPSSRMASAGLRASDSGVGAGVAGVGGRVTCNVRVYYEIVNPVAGVRFVLPHPQAFPDRSPHMYTYSAPCGARMWLPCLEGAHQMCTWEMEYTVTDPSLLVVSSGELLEQVINEDDTEKMFRFRLDVPTSAPCIAVAVGPFEVLPDPNLPMLVTHFCLPGRMRELRVTTNFLQQVFDEYAPILEADFPYNSYKQVFVEEAALPCMSSASMTVCSSTLLHDETIIDQTFNTRRLLADAVAHQWFGCYITARSWSDTWILRGLQQYLTNQFHRKSFGNNDLRYLFMSHMNAVCNQDKSIAGGALYPPSRRHLHSNNFYEFPPLAAGATVRRPLHSSSYLHPLELHTHSTVCKSVLVIQMLERMMGSTFFHMLLHSLIVGGREEGGAKKGKVKGDGASGGSGGSGGGSGEKGEGQKDIHRMVMERTLTQHHFFRTVKKNSAGIDIKSFQKRWVEGSKIPKFVCGFWFNRKKHTTEFALRQDTEKEAERFSGTLVVRVHEVDGAFDHLINFDDSMHSYEFVCRSRLRKNRRKKMFGPEGEEIDLDHNRKNDTPLLWLRTDPDMDWLRVVTFRQPEFMWINQLEDKDVISQHDAIDGLKSFLTQTTSVALDAILRNYKVYYRVRMKAAMVMARCATRETSWLGLDQLLNFTRANFFTTPDAAAAAADGASSASIPLANNFADFPLYFIKRAIVISLSTVRGPDGHTPSDVLSMLLELIKINDNTQNEYSDYLYLADLIRALANTNTKDLMQDLPRTLKQITRYLNNERVLPSYQHEVLIACMQSLCELHMTRDHVPVSTLFFLEYVAYGNYEKVRVTAIECLVRLAGREWTAPHLSAPLVSAADAAAALGSSSAGVDGDPRVVAWKTVFSLLESPDEPSSFKHAVVCSLLSPALFPIVRYCLSGEVDRSHIPDCVTATDAVDTLWKLLVSSHMSLDTRVHYATYQLYQHLWGTDTPLCVKARVTSEGAPPLASLKRQATREKAAAARQTAAVESSKRSGAPEIKLRFTSGAGAAEPPRATPRLVLPKSVVASTSRAPLKPRAPVRPIPPPASPKKPTPPAATSPRVTATASTTNSVSSSPSFPRVTIKLETPATASTPPPATTTITSAPTSIPTAITTAIPHIKSGKGVPVNVANILGKTATPPSSSRSVPPPSSKSLLTSISNTSTGKKKATIKIPILSASSSSPAPSSSVSLSIPSTPKSASSSTPHMPATPSTPYVTARSGSGNVLRISGAAGAKRKRDSMSSTPVALPATPTEAATPDLRKRAKTTITTPRSTKITTKVSTPGGAVASSPIGVAAPARRNSLISIRSSGNSINIKTSSSSAIGSPSRLGASPSPAVPPSSPSANTAQTPGKTKIVVGRSKLKISFGVKKEPK